MNEEGPNRNANSRTSDSQVAVRQLSSCSAPQVQKTQKPKRKPVQRRSPRGERRIDSPAPRVGSTLRKRPLRTRVYGGVGEG